MTKKLTLKETIEMAKQAVNEEREKREAKKREELERALNEHGTVPSKINNTK